MKRIRWLKDIKVSAVAVGVVAIVCSGALIRAGVVLALLGLNKPLTEPLKWVLAVATTSVSAFAGGYAAAALSPRPSLKASLAAGALAALWYLARGIVGMNGVEGDEWMRGTALSLFVPVSALGGLLRLRWPGRERGRAG